MSWQATAWAVRQKVGPPARKLLLLVLANYADADGICWPSQETLAEDTGMSVDTVQRQSKKLVADGFLSITRPPKRRGQWQTFNYQLSVSSKPSAPQNAARTTTASMQEETTPVSSGSYCGLAEPHPLRNPNRTAMRLNPSKEPSIEPSHLRTSANAGERLLTFQKNQEATEVTQNRIAGRIGPDGWSIFGELSEADQERLTAMERRRKLDDNTLGRAILRSRLSRPP